MIDVTINDMLLPAKLNGLSAVGVKSFYMEYVMDKL